MMKKCMACVLAAAVACAAVACGKTTENPADPSGLSWLQVVNSYEDDKQSYIGAHGEPSPTPENYATAKEMGLDFLFLFDDQSALPFELAEQTGLKTIVSMKNTLYTYTGVDWRTDWSQYPANIAVDYFDEPVNRYFEHVSGWVDQHNEKYAATGGQNPLFWVNLLPLDADLGVESGDDGLAVDETYVKRYCEQILSKIAGTPILSYDYYPMQAMYAPGAVFSYNFVATGWLRTVEIMAKYAKLYDADTHAYIQTCGFYEPDPRWNSWICRPVTEDDMRFQVYASMAYGIRNFTHFTYVTSSISHYTESCIDKNGNKTELWYQAQTINNEIHELDHVFLAFDWQGTSTVVGERNLQADPEYRNAAFDRLEYSLDGFAGVADVAADGDTLAGQFYDEVNDRHALMLVNYSEPTDNLTDTVTVTAKEGTRSFAVYKRGEWSEYKVTDGNATVPLAPGEGAFMIAV